MTYVIAEPCVVAINAAFRHGVPAVNAALVAHV